MNQIKFKFEISEEGVLQIKNSKKLQKDLKSLSPGVVYEGILRAIPPSVIQKKKAYFAMESDLAKHLGEKKDELHRVLSLHIGKVMDPETGRPRYESISEVTSDERMVERMHELAEFAALHFDYKFPPIIDDGISGLQLNTAALE